MSAVNEFRDAIESGRKTGEVDAVMARLADDAVFRSPVVDKAYEGR